MRKVRQIFALLLAAFLCLSSASSLALEIGDAIPMVNAGFEEGLENWGIMDETTVSVETEKFHSGKQSLKVHNTMDNAPWVNQYFVVPQPGAMYSVSAWLNTDLVTPERGAGFKVEQYSKDGEYLRDGSFDDGLRQNTNNRWVQHTMNFQTLQETYRVKVYLRCYSEGTAWYDDIEVKLSGGPEPYSCYMDHIFHYPDEKTGSATVSVDPYYAADSEEATSVSAYFTFLDTDGKTVLDKKENVAIQNREASYTYPVSLMKEKTAQYKLHVELRDNKTGETIREWTENKYVYDRPEWMPENGKFIIDGEPFYPIIGYHVDPEMVPNLYENGKPVINTIQLGVGAASNDERNTYVMTEFAKYPEVKGLYSLYPGGKTAGHPDNLERTKQRVEMLKDNPQIIAWIVMDEPLGGGMELEERKAQLELAYREIRAIDPKRPVYLLDYGTAHMETIKYCDVFVADVYQRGDSARAVSQVIEPLTAKHTRLSTYELACAFESGNVFPPVRTIRASVYRGLEAGGSYGTGFYAISDAIGHDKEDEDKALYLLDEWKPITQLCQEELPILFAHYGGDGGTTFNTYREGELYEEHLWETWFDEKGDMYLMAHNRSAKTADFNIPLVSKNGKIRVGEYKAEPIGLTETGEKSGTGSISLTLEQEQIALYKITPSEKVDLSLIDAPSFDDVSGDYAWASSAVAKTQALGIINGKGEGIFAPAEAITRGDFAGFLIRTLGFTSESTENFADVPAEREYAKEIAIGKALGILNGVGENIFNPDLAITRQDMMTICARGMKMAEKLRAADASALDAFHDKANVAEYALESVSAMIASGIIKGDDAGYLNPTGNTRRAEAAVIMERILNAEKVAATPAGTPDAPKAENETVEFEAPTEEQMAKYNRSAALLKGIGTADITLEASITNGEAEAVVSAAIGMDFDAFGENHKALTTAAAAEGFVKLLGYEAYTQRDGGFMATAARIDLLKGIDTSEEYLRGGEFALMLENALGIYLCDRVAFGEGANEEYAESTDTLLTRYRHFTLYKGVLEQNENTGLPKGKVAIGTNLLETGKTDAKNYIGQRVEAYTAGEENTIVYIRAHKSVIVTQVAADKISTSEATLSNFVYEDETGHTKSIAIDGAKLLYNGKYKMAPYTADILMPKMGAVTVIENGGSNAAYVLVEEYVNGIVESIYAKEEQIFFKNHDMITWDETDTAKRLTMEGGTFSALKEWDVVSLYESEDGSVVRAVVSNKTIQGTATEISAKEVILGGETFKIADNTFGSPALGEKYTYLLDAFGKIAGVNDKAVIKNYAYLTNIFQNKGIDGTVQIRVFTKNAEMKVYNLKDTVFYNDDASSVPASELMTKTELIEDKETKAQLIVLETAGEGENEVVTSIKTAENLRGKPLLEREAVFSMDDEIGHEGTDSEWASKRRFDGHGKNSIADKYLVESNTLYFVVPETTSEDPSDYKIKAVSAIEHGDYFEDSKLYDINADQEIAVIVQTVADTAGSLDAGLVGVVKSLGRALNEDGEAVLSLTLQRFDEEKLYFAKDDFNVLLEGAITSVEKGEPKHDKEDKDKPIDKYILPSDLEVGDVVLFATSPSDPQRIDGLRVLCRGNYADNAEISGNTLREYYNYSELTYAFGTVDRLVNRGFMMTPGQWERLFVLDMEDAPIVLVENGEVKTVPKEEVRVTDRVFVQKTNPWHVITVIYR